MQIANNDSRLQEVRHEKFEKEIAATKDTLASLKQLFPGLTERQYADLDEWYTGYAALILRMYTRITGDSEAYARFLALTSRPSRPTMTGKVDSSKETSP